MSFKLKILIILILSVYGLDVNAQYSDNNNDSISSVRDTSELNAAVTRIISDLDSTNTIDLDKVNDLLSASLLLKDTTTFFDFSNHICYNYFLINEIQEEGIDFLNHNHSRLEDRDYEYGENYNSYGIFHEILNFHSEAIDYYFKTLRWYEKYNPEHLHVPFANIAWLYYENKEYESALKYMQHSLNSSLEVKEDERRLYTCAWDYADIGLIYHKLGKNEEAEIHLKKSLETIQKFNSHYDREDPVYFRVLERVLYFYTETSNYTDCERLIKAAEKICDEFKNCPTLEKANYEIQKNRYYLKIGALDKALDADSVIQNYSIFGEKEPLLYAIDYYTKVKDIDNLIINYDRLAALNDSILIANRTLAYSNIQEKHNNLKLTEQNKALTKNIESRNRILFIVLSILTLLTSLFVLQTLNNRRYKKLNQELNNKKLDLEKTNQELETTNEELERFTFITAHDLKTPLLTIISFSSLLEDKLSPTKDQEINKYLSFIKEGGKRLDNLLNDSLEYFVLSKKDFVLANEKVDINGLLDALENSLSGFIKEKNGKIIHLGHLPIIKSDYSSLLTLFQKIIENGILYNNSDVPTIKIYAQEDSEFHKIFFEDNGIGIKEEYREQVFTMFYRLQNHQDYSGSGLGLAICKRLTTRLGGKLHIHGNENVGITLELRIPKNLSV